MEQLGFSQVSVKQTKWLALGLVKYMGVKLIGWSIVTKDRFKFLSALQIKYFLKKLILYEIQCKKKDIPQSRYARILILRTDMANPVPIWPRDTPRPYNNLYLSYDVAPESEITPWIKIDKPLTVYRFSGNIMKWP